jgi:mono/diheme cytochrome c family protein
MNPDGTDINVFATGFRNPYDLVFTPNGDLFATDNNPDQFDEQLSFLPPEELNHVQEGLNYGFPDVFSPMPYPENVEPPVVDLTASVGSAGLAYYDAEQFPEAFQDGVFVAQWGSNTLENSNGQRVIFVALERDDTGLYVGTREEFLTFNPNNNGSHPVDVTVGPHGALYIAEYMSGFIYRVTYTGETDEKTSLDPINLGEAIYRKGVTGVPSCASCHLANGTGLGPVLNGIAATSGQRVQGLSAPEYLRQSIVEPNAYIVEGYSPGVMFQDYGNALSEEQIDALTTYLLTLD